MYINILQLFYNTLQHRHQGCSLQILRSKRFVGQERSQAQVTHRLLHAVTTDLLIIIIFFTKMKGQTVAMDSYFT